MKSSTKFIISTAVAGLLSLSSSALRADEHGSAGSAKGECHGVNACKGKGECGGEGHSCAGKNECKGKGWVTKTEAECKALKGKFKAE